MDGDIEIPDASLIAFSSPAYNGEWFTGNEEPVLSQPGLSVSVEPVPDPLAEEPVYLEFLESLEVSTLVDRYEAQLYFPAEQSEALQMLPMEEVFSSFSVELYRSRSKVESNNPLFRGIRQEVFEYYDEAGGEYVYTTGKASWPEELYSEFAKVKSLGFSSARVKGDPGSMVMVQRRFDSEIPLMKLSPRILCSRLVICLSIIIVLS